MSLRDYRTEGFKSAGMREGADIEKAVFGTPPTLPQDRKNEYVPFQEAVLWVKEHQPAPQDRPRIASNLRKMVAELASDMNNPVKFFTAVGTPLDRYHGVDAFLEQRGRIVTVDISQKEKEFTKADVLLVASIDPEGRVSVAPDELRMVAEQIAKKLGEQKRMAA